MKEKILATADVTKLTLHGPMQRMHGQLVVFLILSYLQSALLLVGQPKKQQPGG